MDLKEKKPVNEAQPLELVDIETGNPLTDADGKTCRVWLYGEDSEPMLKRQRELAAIRANAARRTGDIVLTPAQVERDGIETLVAVTERFENVNWGGEAVDKNQELIRTVYKELRWVAEQADRFVRDRRNFMKRQSGS